MKIVELIDLSLVIEEPIISWIRDQNLLFESSSSIVVKLLTGVYKAYMSINDNGKITGIIVCSFTGIECTTILVYAKNQLLELRHTFYEMLKENGIHKVRTFSHKTSSGYERLIDMKHIYSYYEKEL